MHVSALYRAEKKTKTWKKKQRTCERRTQCPIEQELRQQERAYRNNNNDYYYYHFWGEFIILWWVQQHIFSFAALYLCRSVHMRPMSFTEYNCAMMPHRNCINLMQASNNFVVIICSFVFLHDVLFIKYTICSLHDMMIIIILIYMYFHHGDEMCIYICL